MPWFTITAKANAAAEILIYDEIGSGRGVSAADFDAQLKAIGKVRELTLRINSPGGDTMSAAAIFNILEPVKASGTHIVVYIDGLAASAASWIAMVGNEVVMPANALMMIHDPAGLVVGGSDDMRSIAGVLDTIKQNMASAYSAKSGKPLAVVKAIMLAETWYSADEAVAAGFADRVEQPIKIAAQFDLGKFAKHPPPATTIAELSEQFWAKRTVVPPRPADHDSIWAHYNGRPN